MTSSPPEPVDGGPLDSESEAAAAVLGTLRRQVALLEPLAGRGNGSFHSLEWRVRENIATVAARLPAEAPEQRDLAAMRAQIRRMNDVSWIESGMSPPTGRPNAARAPERGASRELPGGLPGLGKRR